MLLKRRLGEKEQEEISAVSTALLTVSNCGSQDHEVLDQVGKELGFVRNRTSTYTKRANSFGYSTGRMLSLSELVDSGWMSKVEPRVGLGS